MTEQEILDRVFGALKSVAPEIEHQLINPEKLLRDQIEIDSMDFLNFMNALRTAFVVIPFGTVVLEELAFRSVLWAFLSRHLREWPVLLTTSVVFGFWHVIPARRAGESNRAVSDAIGEGGSAAVVAGTVALTTIGGLVFGELRRRSGSVLASACAHWATNALGVLFGLVVWRRDPGR